MRLAAESRLPPKSTSQTPPCSSASHSEQGGQKDRSAPRTSSTPAAQWTKLRDAMAMLDVPLNCGEEELRSAWKDAVRLWHPDRNHENEEEAERMYCGGRNRRSTAFASFPRGQFGRRGLGMDGGGEH